MRHYNNPLQIACKQLPESFLAVPIAYMLLNVCLACTVSLVTSPEKASLVSKAVRMSGLVSTAAITIVTLSFSLTVLSIQIASQMYSPRLLDDFLKDPVAKVVISVNLGAYVYCYTLQYFLDDTSEEPNVPYISIQLLSVHMALILAAFTNFIHVFINGFRVENILSRAAASSLRAAQILSDEHHKSYPLFNSSKRTTTLERSLTTPPSQAYKVLADKSGYVNQFLLQNVLPLAEKLDVCVRYSYQIGEFVNEGTILCYIWDTKTNPKYREIPLQDRAIELLVVGDDDDDDTKSQPWEEQVERKLGLFANKGIYISQVRSRDLDVTLGIQQLCDIAVRALSQAINDPHTAIQSMDTLSSLLASLGVMELGVPAMRDKFGRVRACAPRRSFSFLLSLLDTIRRYGCTDLGVCRRALRLFGDLASILIRAKRLERVVPALAQLRQWMITSRETFPEGSPELQNLQELYDHLLDTISDSEEIVLKRKKQYVERDLQFLHTTLEANSEAFHSSSTSDTGKDVLEYIKRLNSDTSSTVPTEREGIQDDSMNAVQANVQADISAMHWSKETSFGQREEALYNEQEDQQSMPIQDSMPTQDMQFQNDEVDVREYVKSLESAKELTKSSVRRAILKRSATDSSPASKTSLLPATHLKRTVTSIPNFPTPLSHARARGRSTPLPTVECDD